MRYALSDICDIKSAGVIVAIAVLASITIDLSETFTN